MRIQVVLAVLLTAVLEVKASTDTLWMGVYINGTKVGYQHICRSQTGDTVVTHTKGLTCLRRPPGGPVASTSDVTMFETKRGIPLSFTSIQKSSGIQSRAEGTFGVGDSVRIRVFANGKVDTLALPWPANGMLNEGIRLKCEATPPQTGDTAEYATLSIGTLAVQQVVRKVVGRKPVLLLGGTDTLFEIESKIRSNGSTIGVISYVSDDWTSKKEEIGQAGLRIEMYECPQDSAEAGIHCYDVFSATVVTHPVGMKDVTDYGSCDYVLRLPPNVRFSSSDEQQVTVLSGTETRVSVKKVGIGRGVRFPLPATPQDKQMFLSPSVYIQSEDSLIKEYTRTAIGHSRYARRALRRISSFVRSTIVPSLEVGYATARETAYSKKGDCTEFALLTTAMCRAAGIPARVANGLTSVPPTGDFYYHAWTQVFIGGKWISIDPAMRRFDPGHIAISYSSDGRPSLGVMEVIGDLRIISASPSN